MISCTLFCTTPETCPYSKDNPKFNPELRRVKQHVPMDYISPATLQAIQDSKSVKCVKSDGNYKPPQGKDFCFVCASEDLELTVPVIGVDNFNEIVFTTAFGPSVAALWTILIFEHLVFMIKFFVMALVCAPFALHFTQHYYLCLLLEGDNVFVGNPNAANQIPDITSDIQEQLTGHDTYRRRLAMGRNGHTSVHHSSKQQQQSNLVTSLGAPNEESAALQSLPEVRSSLKSLRGCPVSLNFRPG
jgi:hypothetical protein